MNGRPVLLGEAAGFLAGRYGGRARDVSELGGGDWSRAFSFRLDGRDLVARFGRYGMGEHALRYGKFAQAMNGHGLVVYAQDHRGHGATAGQGELGDLGEGGWPALVADIGLLSARIRAEHPGLPLILLGHSMGSFAVQQHLLDHSADADAVILTGTAVIDLLEPALDLDQPLDLAMFNAAFQPARTDYDWLSRDEAVVDA